jgi:predicted ATPase
VIDGAACLGYPDALIYECDEYGLQSIAYDDAEPVRLTRSFLGAPEQFLRNLLD